MGRTRVNNRGVDFSSQQQLQWERDPFGLRPWRHKSSPILHVGKTPTTRKLRQLNENVPPDAPNNVRISSLIKNPFSLKSLRLSSFLRRKVQVDLLSLIHAPSSKVAKKRQYQCRLSTKQLCILLLLLRLHPHLQFVQSFSFLNEGDPCSTQQKAREMELSFSFFFFIHACNLFRVFHFLNEEDPC